MSLIFSKVTITADDMNEEFLVGGIPREAYDLEDCSAYEDFTDQLSSTCDVTVQAEVYLCGEGESQHASEDELADLERRIRDDPDLLGSNEFNAIESITFLFEWNTDELFGTIMEE